MPQQRVGWRAYVASTISSLLTSLYGAWNGDTTGTSLDASIFGAWNAEASGTSLDTSIFAVYNADGDANDSKGTNHGTLVNGATFSTGKIGQAFQFDGTNDYLKLPNNSLNFIDDFSVGFWMKLGSLNQTSYIIDSAGFSGIGTTGWVLNLTSGNLNFTIHNNNNASSIGANYVLTSTSVWYHIVITSKSGYNAIYINNSLIMSNTSTMRPNYVASPYSIPYIGVFKTANTQFFNGNIDGLNFWNKSLTVDEVTQLYNSGNGAQYPYSSQSLPSPNDAVGTNHGTLMNGASFTTGKIGNAFTFDGVNDYVSFPTNSWNSLVGTDLTISLWVKFSSTANQTLISNMSSPSINVWSGWEIRLVGGQPTIYMWNNSGTGVGAQGAVVSTNTWYHIVATRKKGSRTRIYINGSLAQTDTNTPDPSINGTYYPNIGHLQYSSTYHGLYMTNGSLIDSVNLWSKEISADEVTQLYNAGNGTQYPYSSQTLPSTMNQLGIDNATLMNGCTFGDGKIGKAFTFDGVNDYVSLPNNSLNLVNNYSINLWLYLTSSQSTTLLSVFGNDGFNKGFYIDITSLSSYTFRFVGFNNNSNVIALNGTGNLGYLNRWSMATLTVSGTSVKIYLDGTLASSGEMSVPINYTSTTYPTLGAFRNGSGTPNSHLSNGTKIDGLSVWQKELTQAEVTELYNSGAGKQITATPIVTNGLVLNLDASRTSSYPGSGTTWTDISGNGNNGTMVNGPVFGTASGGVITFDGVNDRITLQSANISATGNWTISSWFNLSSLPAVDINSNLYSQYISIPGNGRMILRLLNESGIVNKFQLFLGGGSGYSSQAITGTTTAQINTFYNLVGIRNGSVFSLYLNGNLEASLDLTGTNISILQTTPEIGGTISGNFGWLNGKIYNTLVYNRALSTTEITQNFNATKSRFGL